MNDWLIDDDERKQKWIPISKKNLTTFFYIKMNQPRPLFNLFSSFQPHITNFTTNKCEKMSIQYTVPEFELTTFGTWVSSHNH